MKIIDPSEVAEAICKGAVECDDFPLQIPGRDKVTQKMTIAGPKTRMDTRMYFDAIELDGLLEIAKASMSTRVELIMVGLEVTTFEAKSGHVYQVWKLVSAKPRPETNTIVG